MKDINLAQELEENRSILLLVDSIDYNDIIIKNIQDMKGKTVCYVTLNKTFSSLKETFEKKKIKIDKIVFIDGISKTIKSTPDQTDSCYYVSSPSALTEISLAISKFLKHHFDYIVFDSLTSLLIYQKKAPVATFVQSIVNKIKESNTKALFYAVKVKEQEDLITEAEMFVDKVIDLGKN